MPRGGRRPGSGRKPGKTGPQAQTLATRKAVRESRELTAQATLEAIRRGSQFDIRRLFDARGNYKPIHTLTAEEAFCIAGVKLVKRNLTAGDGQVDTVLELKIIDRSRYVEMAAKHHGLLTEKIEITGEVTLGEKIARARARLQPKAEE